jgi:hypothetical protein
MCNCKEGFAVNQAGSKCEPKKKNTKPKGKNVKSDEQEAKKEAKKKVAKTGGGKKEKSKNNKESAKRNEPQAVITEVEREESRQKTGKQVEAARQTGYMCLILLSMSLH